MSGLFSQAILASPTGCGDQTTNPSPQQLVRKDSVMSIRGLAVYSVLFLAFLFVAGCNSGDGGKKITPAAELEDASSPNIPWSIRVVDQPDPDELYFADQATIRIAIDGINDNDQLYIDEYQWVGGNGNPTDPVSATISGPATNPRLDLDFSGAPTGTYEYTVEVTDSQGDWRRRTFTVSVDRSRVDWDFTVDYPENVVNAQEIALRVEFTTDRPAHYGVEWRILSGEDEGLEIITPFRDYTLVRLPDTKGADYRLAVRVTELRGVLNEFPEEQDPDQWHTWNEARENEDGVISLTMIIPLRVEIDVPWDIELSGLLPEEEELDENGLPTGNMVPGSLRADRYEGIQLHITGDNRPQITADTIAWRKENGAVNERNSIILRDATRNPMFVFPRNGLYQYSVMVTDDQERSRVLAFEIPVDYQPELYDPFAFTGTVRHDGLREGGETVQLKFYPRDEAGQDYEITVLQTTTDSQGRYSFPGLISSPRNYAVEINPEEDDD